MKINIKATGIELTTAIRDYATKKISSLEKYLPAEAASADVVSHVEVGKSTQHHKSGNVFRAEVHIIGAGIDLYAVSEQEDLYAAIDTMKDDIVRSLTQSKSKRQTLTRRGAELAKNMMKGLTDTAGRGLSWGWNRVRSFKKRK